MALDVQVSSSFFTDDAAEIGKSVCVRKFFIINLDWSCVGGVQRHNFSLLAADVKAKAHIRKFMTTSTRSKCVIQRTPLNWGSCIFMSLVS